LAAQKIRANRSSDLIGLFPGSREREVRKIFPILIDVMRRLRQQRPAMRFEVAAASADLAAMMEQMLAGQGEAFKVEIKTGDSAGLMQRAAAGVVASGSATLEAAYFRFPFVLIYKVAGLTYLAARLVVRVPHLGMPNLLAGKEIVPEFIQHRAEPAAIFSEVLSLLDDQTKRNGMVAEFDAIMSQLGEGGASQLAAREIISELNR
jgi:lipid-A-disaccharide synthase